VSAQLGTSYVSGEFKKVESDLLFQVPTKDPGTSLDPAFVYVLWEHQYKEDRFLRWRLGYYMMNTH
jgi:hypothetical protein